MDYLETIDDPLKFYFKERIGNLYLNKDVMKLFLDKGNKGEGKSVQMLSDSFMNFSEIKDLEKNTKDPTRLIDRKSFAKKKGRRSRKDTDSYEQVQIKKKVDAMMVDKVNTFVQKSKEANKHESKFDEFGNNDSLVKGNLDIQISVLSSRLFARKQKSFIKGELKRFIKVFCDQ